MKCNSYTAGQVMSTWLHPRGQPTPCRTKTIFYSRKIVSEAFFITYVGVNVTVMIFFKSAFHFFTYKTLTKHYGVQLIFKKCLNKD